MEAVLCLSIVTSLPGTLDQGCGTLRDGGFVPGNGTLACLISPSLFDRMLKHRLPRQRILHLRRLRSRGGRVSRVRHHGRRRHSQAGGRRFPGTDLPRNHWWVGDSTRWSIRLGLLLSPRTGRSKRLL